LPLLTAALFAPGPLMLGAAALTSLALAGAAIYWLLSPLRALTLDARKIVDNRLMQLVYTGRTDEFGQIQLALKLLRSDFGAVVGRMADVTNKVTTSAKTTAQTIEEARTHVDNQQDEINQISTAMNQMADTVQEITHHAEATATLTHSSVDMTKEGQRLMADVVTANDHLAEEVSRASKVVENLGISSQNIGSVLDVIRGIAEQTNLLALNAAIEAARAGEQGRGFAVVADEVRTLAGRTQESTKEIQDIIETLQQGVSDAANVMTQSCELATSSVNKVADARANIDTIISSIHTMNDMAKQIATAAEQLFTGAGEVSRNVSGISFLANETSQGAQQAADSSHALVNEIEMSQRLIHHFKAKKH